jgi:hypothetical protein
MDRLARGLCRMVVASFLAASGGGCGGEVTSKAEPVDSGNVVPADAGGANPPSDGAQPGPDVIIGPIDFSKAPPELPLACQGDAGHVAFENPCKVGLDLSTGSQAAGAHETECRLAGSSDPVIWQFVLPLAQIAQHPSTPLRFPGDVPSIPVPGAAIDVGGESFKLTLVEGTLSFVQIDPPGRAFVGRFDAKLEWTGDRGSSFGCDAGGPL